MIDDKCKEKDTIRRKHRNEPFFSSVCNTSNAEAKNIMSKFPFLCIYGTEGNVITFQFLLQMETKESFPIPQKYISALIRLK